MIIFGAQVLALTEDGSRLFTWNKATGGISVLFDVFRLMNQPNESRFRFIYGI